MTYLMGQRLDCQCGVILHPYQYGVPALADYPDHIAWVYAAHGADFRAYREGGDPAHDISDGWGVIVPGACRPAPAEAW